MSYKQGEIYHANLGEIGTAEIKGHEQGGKRPVVIVKNIGNNLLWIVPITKNIDKLTPRKVLIGKGTETGLTHNSVALIEQISVISTDRILYRHGHVSEEIMDAILYCLHDMLDGYL